MPYKSLLAFHAVGEPVESLDQIIELAGAANAHLDIIVLGTLLSPPVVMHDVAPAAEWVLHNRETTDLAMALVARIEQHVAAKEISATVAAECDYPGNLEKIAARYAFCSDVHVGTHKAIKAVESMERAFNGALFDAGCPVLLLPETPVNFKEMTRIAVAWNGRVEAARTVRCALPLLAAAERVNLVVIDPVENDVGQDPGSDLAAHLSRYGIDITIDVLASGGMSVAQKLNQRALDIGADLLVMGGYGHTKFREWLLGGATREMLQGAPIPVFMAH